MKKKLFMTTRKRLARGSGKFLLTTVLAGMAIRAFAMGGDYPNNQHVEQVSWPKGMAALVNSTNRSGGHWVNEKDWFFFAGSKTNFYGFLNDYSKIPGIAHRLILHTGKGEAYDLGGGNRRPCDWSIEGGPAEWVGGKASKFVLDVNFWLGGSIPFDRASVPTNIEIINEMPPPGGAN